MPLLFKSMGCVLGDLLSMCSLNASVPNEVIDGLVGRYGVSPRNQSGKIYAKY